MAKKLADSKKGDEISIKVFQKRVSVIRNCDIALTNEFSCHAKSDDLIGFLHMFNNIKGIFINHGEEETKIVYQSIVQSNIITPYAHILTRNTCYVMKNFLMTKTLNSKFNNNTQKPNKKSKKEKKFNKPRTVKRCIG